MNLSLILWGIVLIAALALEGVGVLEGNDRWWTLTDIIRKWVPRAIIALSLIWLAHHFLVTA